MPHTPELPEGWNYYGRVLQGVVVSGAVASATQPPRYQKLTPEVAAKVLKRTELRRAKGEDPDRLLTSPIMAGGQ